MGGLGLVSLKSRNMIMLAKWFWRSYSERSAWWNKVLVSKFGEVFNYDLGRIEFKKDISYPIQSILRICTYSDIFALVSRRNFNWVLENGESVYFWEDSWLPDGPLMYRIPGLYRLAYQSLLTHL